MRRMVIAVLVAAAASPLHAQSDTASVRKVVGGTLRIEQETQQKRDAWAAEKADLQARYGALKANVAFLVERKAVVGQRLEALNESLAELDRRFVESKRIEGSLQDTMNAIALRLSRRVRDDLPFLAEERRARLAGLDDVLARPGVSPGEKLRRLLEALQVETSYGVASEVTDQKIAVAGDTLFAQVLRIGRLSLFWRTPDGKRSGGYDRAALAWVELPGSYERRIGQAIEMAQRLRPIEIITLPIGRIQP